MKSPSAGVRGPQRSTVGSKSETGLRRLGTADRVYMDSRNSTLDVVDSELLEKVQAAVRHGVGILTGECLGSDTNPKHDGADGLSLSNLDKANEVYGRPPNPHGI